MKRELPNTRTETGKMRVIDGKSFQRFFTYPSRIHQKAEQLSVCAYWRVWALLLFLFKIIFENLTLRDLLHVEISCFFCFCFALLRKRLEFGVLINTKPFACEKACACPPAALQPHAIKDQMKSGYKADIHCLILHRT